MVVNPRQKHVAMKVSLAAGYASRVIQPTRRDGRALALSLQSLSYTPTGTCVPLSSPAPMLGTSSFCAPAGNGGPLRTCDHFPLYDVRFSHVGSLTSNKGFADMGKV